MKIIYADGSSLGNPGKAGMGVVALDTERKKVWEYGENLGRKTNNQAELSACIFLLQLILKSGNKEKKEMDKIGKTHQTEQKFEVRLDSQYVIKGATIWSKGWVKNGWMNSQKKPVENKELWEQIVYLKEECEALGIKILWSHVYGHTGEIWNERVDEIARSFASEKEPILRKGEKYI